jgi:membrane protein YdbS with pleckstrin-like domain
MVNIMLITILIIALAIAVAGSSFWQKKLGYWGWSPVGLVLLVVLIFWLTGYIHI